MEAVERLLAVEEIKQLKARYFRFVDSKQWDKFEQLFLPNASIDHSGDHPDAKFDDRRQWVEMVSSGMKDVCSIHHGHTPEIEILSPTTARGIWAMQDWLSWPEGVILPTGDRAFIGWGHYHETYEKTAEGWRIASIRLVRTRFERTPA